MSPPCYTYIFWVVRSAFYSDVHLLGDSHVQRQRHGFPFYNILWRLYHSGKPLFSDVMGFHFIVAETVATLIYVYNCLYIYKSYITIPHHNIPYLYYKYIWLKWSIYFLDSKHWPVSVPFLVALILEWSKSVMALYLRDHLLAVE